MDEFPSTKTFHFTIGAVAKEDTDNVRAKQVAAGVSAVKELRNRIRKMEAEANVAREFQKSANEVVAKAEATECDALAKLTDTGFKVLKQLRTALVQRDPDNRVKKECHKSNIEISRNGLRPEKANNSDISDGVIDSKVGLNTSEGPLEAASHPEDRCSHTSRPSLFDKIQHPMIRKQMVEGAIAFYRECERLKAVWAKRGLPVDKETVSSAARKDTFDLSDLNKALPSTSASGEDPEFAKFKMWLLTGIKERRSTVSTPVERVHQLAEDEKNDLRLKCALQGARRFIALQKSLLSAKMSSSELGQKAECDEQKEANEEMGDPDMNKDIQNVAREERSDIAEMPLDDKELEKRKSDAENNQQESTDFPPLPKSHLGPGQCSVIHLRNRMMTDSEIRTMREESVKRNVEVLKKEQLVRWLRLKSKWRMWDSHRGVQTGDMDGESVSDPPSEPALDPSIVAATKALSLKDGKMRLEMVKHSGKSVKDFRTFQ